MDKKGGPAAVQSLKSMGKGKANSNDPHVSASNGLFNKQDGQIRANGRVFLDLNRQNIPNRSEIAKVRAHAQQLLGRNRSKDRPAVGAPLALLEAIAE